MSFIKIILDNGTAVYNPGDELKGALEWKFDKEPDKHSDKRILVHERRFT
ncbi:MAG: hypothetical protein GY750_01515 [Lentisphaerae bacterium]|nr:hypothetical protein [Lentisphaerota bacterium]MCP4100098.1 hypothetical protein [Lentisphaerota bacterium]